MSSSITKTCPICMKPLDTKDQKEVVTECGHTFHRDCAQKRLDTTKKADCKVCHMESALANALNGDKTTTTRVTTEQNSNQAKSTKNISCSIISMDEKKGHTALASTLTTTSESSTIEKEWQCKKCSIENTASAKRCESCGELRHALPFSRDQTTAAAIDTEPEYTQRFPSNADKQDKSHRPNSESKTKGKRHDVSKATTPRITNSKEHQQQQQRKKNKLEWECQNCEYMNDISFTCCANCKKRKLPDSLPTNSGKQSPIPLAPVHRPSSSDVSDNSITKIYPDLNASRSTTPQLASDRPPLPKIGSSSTLIETTMAKTTTTTHVSNKNNKSSKESMPQSPSLSPPRREVVVYISDLPSDIQDNLELERLVRHRIEKTLEVKPGDIKCYSKLGMGSIRVADDKVKDRLIKDVGKIAFDPKVGKTMISFVDTLELVSYIVLSVTKEKKDNVLPTAEEVSRRWIELYKGEKPRSCNQLSVQFPNIYRIASTSLDELVRAMLNQDFSIKNQFARVYFHADCSFLEDLPKSTTEDQLREVIIRAIKQPNIPSSSLYIQLNKNANNACIIVTDLARKWTEHSFLYLENKPISKKENLTCRLVVHPVPQTFAINSIINHQIFSGKVINHKHSGENLILELSDKNVFDQCVTQGALRVNEKLVLHISTYTILNNSEESEIDTDTWYETEMLRYKPDIMQFIADMQHVIFRYKWNSSIWLEQFNRTATHSHDGYNNATPRDSKGMTGDQIRHLLRMTEMLNTIAVIRKKSYMVGDREVKLNLDKKLKTIVYDHGSKLEQGGKPITTTPYKVTTVEVVNEDCLITYERLANKGRRPLLLNMASATSPGGGYRKGDGAQEENLFRRSDYFRSLDIDLDGIQEQRPERFRCLSNCKLDPITDQSKMYPMDEFGAIYTSGLTVFRQPENTGYAFMEKPLAGVCSLAMAAYRDPKLEGNILAPKYAVGTRKKIENIFAIAHHHQHDCLVLSALGCGAFKNPPDHIVKLFCSVIEQYAGFFKSITFAIVDDHNSGHQLNPEGNLKPFMTLDGMAVEPIILMNKSNIKLGPYRLLTDDSTIADVCIFDLTPCNFGAKCYDMYNQNHARQYSHPPLCAKACLTGKCPLTNDPVHMWSLIHQNQCQYGGECREIDNDKHAREFEHPSYCPARGNCNNMTEEHLRQYRHLPLCKYSHKCMEFQKHVKAHCDAYRHSTPRCPYGSFCANFHDQKHTDAYQHPFPTPCPFTPFHCSFHTRLTQTSDTRMLSRDIQQHCLDFAHVCRFGRECTDKTLLHWEKSIHIARNLCPYGDKCTKIMQEDHLNSFTHSKIDDIRRLCKHADKCHDRRKPDHMAKFRHATTFEDSGVVRYYNLNENTNFVQNQNDSIARVTNYVQDQKWTPLPSGSVPREILDWLHTVQPVHRCNPVIFESILLHGHVMSRDYMEHLKKPKFVANSVLQHSRVRRIHDLNVKSLEEHARDYITALVSDEYEKNGFPDTTPITTTTGVPTTINPPRPSSASHMSTILREEKILSATISSKDMDALKTKAIEIAQASIKLHSNPAGIGYVQDKLLGTDKTVFSILGPHLGHYYGDIVIVFKREILHHPDANFSIQAATSFASGRAYQLRPWLGTDPGSPEERIELYHASKLHASVPGYDYAAALELIALTSHFQKSQTMDIDLQAILDRWLKVDSHQNIEAHLPQLIPLDYIDHIYIPQNIYDSLNIATHRSIDAVFKDRHTVTPHEGESNPPMTVAGPTPSTQSRIDYQNFVVDELIKRFGQHAKMSLSRFVRGAVITIPSTKFNDHFVLPLQISQAYTQYITDHKKPPTDNTIYIYWQAMNGDMMLTLSNEQIDPDEKQPNLRCLICYVAAKSASSDTNYYEQPSYLNSGLPFQHDMFVNKGKYADKSNTFYVGCNTDVFMTYCLEIQRSTGQVTLSHARPNSIYNHKKISYTFGKAELDLTTLEYIYVSAGSHIVPIRNLIICFEKQADLHPTFDAEFKKASFMTMAASDGSTRSSSEHKQQSQYQSHVHNKQTPCKWGSQCRDIGDSQHCAKYSHPHTAQQKSDHRTSCKWGAQCRDQTSTHRTKYSHPRDSEQKQEKSDRRIPCKYGAQCRTIDDASHRAKYSHPTAKEPHDNASSEAED